MPSIAVSEKGARVESATGAGVNDMFHMPDEGLKGTDLISVKPSQKSLALQEIIASLHAASDIKEVIQHIHDGMVRVLGYEGLIIGLLDENRKVFKWSILHTKKKLKMLANVKAVSGIETPAKKDYSKFNDALLNGELYITHHFRDIAEMSLGKVTTCSAIRKAMGAKTFVSVPFLDKGKVLGYMVVATSKKKVTEEETESLTVVAAEAAASLWRIGQTKQSRGEVLAAMQKITASMQSTLQLEQVLQQVSNGALQGLGYDHSFILVVDDEGRFFKGTVLSVRGGALLAKQTKQALESATHLKTADIRVPIERGYSQAWDTILDGKVHITHDLHKIGSPPLSKNACSVIQEILGTKTIAAVPLLVKQNVVGAMLVGTKLDEITDGEIDYLMAFANQAGIAIENAQLFSKTEAKARELKESEEKYKQLLEDVNDGYLVIQDRKIVFVNRRCAELFGYKLEEILERPLEGFVPPDLRQPLVERYERRMRGEVVPERYEWEIAKKDGTIAPVQFNTKSIYYQGKPAVCALITDITERKKVEKELREAYQELEATQRDLISLQRATSSIQPTQELDQILQQLADVITQGTNYDIAVIFLLDEDKEAFRLATISPIPGAIPFVERIFGYKPTEFTIPVNGNCSETIREILDGRVIRTQDLYEIALPRLSRAARSALQGFIKDKSILAVPMIAKERVMGVLVVTTQQEQISERRIELLVSFAYQAASVLENARLLGMEGNEQQRNALLLAISHEFRVPLTSIKTMGGLLAEELKGDTQSPQAKMVDNIRRGADKMERRLGDLLDFARMRTATVELQLETISVKAAIEGAVNLCLPFMLRKKQTIEVDVPDYLSPVILDQLRFERIIINLLTNASKFTLEDGKIRLRAREKDSNLTVEVRDWGIGIPKSELELIFQPYYRGKASKTSSSGLGLGLAIVKELVKLHHGKVWVESKPGKGSTFTFSIPITDGKSAEPRKGDKKRSESTSNRG